MNRKILSLTVLFITLFIGVCRADDIPIYFRDDPRTTKSETPVTGDYNEDSGKLQRARLSTLPSSAKREWSTPQRSQ